MRFSVKSFLAIFLTTISLVTILIWATYEMMTNKINESYLNRYISFSRTIGNTLTQLEIKTETLMLNAAYVVAQEDEKRGLLSTSALKALRDRLNVTHIFVINKEGTFIRSTNEDPQLIPNLFSFCEEYRNLIVGSEDNKRTPIILPVPEPTPFKFLTIPNWNRTHLIEIGVRVEFIGNALLSALSSDPNIIMVNLYTHGGMSLGSFTRQGAIYERNNKVLLPKEFTEVRRTQAANHIFVKVAFSQEHCCQCDGVGISDNGKYYYVLEVVVSNKELSLKLASIGHIFLIIQVLAFIVTVVTSKLVSQRLLSNVKHLIKQVQQLSSYSSGKNKIVVKGNDEIAYLAKEFDALLNRLEKSKEELIIIQEAVAAEKTRSEVASQVAHDIRSPLAALNVIATTSADSFPESERTILRGALTRINDIVNNLASTHLSQGEKATKDDELVLNAELLSSLIESVVSEKRVQFCDKSCVEIVFHMSREGYGLFAEVDVSGFKRVLSNIINNAVEAIKGEKGRVEILLFSKDSNAYILVKDNGVGIPAQILSRIGIKGFSYGKAGGFGLGIYSAKKTVESWGGKLSIESKKGVGTTVCIELRLAKPPFWYVPTLVVSHGDVVVLDDDEVIHHVWEKRFCDKKIKLMHFKTAMEFENWFLVNADKEVGVFLIDYELLKDGKTGLDLIVELGIDSKSILVTNRYEEELILKRSKEFGIKIIPKSMASIIPIRVETPLAYDCVLIDNSSLTRISWENVAKKLKKKLIAFSSPDEFLNRIAEFSVNDTTIYIDSELGLPEKGEETAKKLFELGFKNIYLTTGHEKEHYKNMWWLKGVVTKNPPWINIHAV